MSTAAAKAEARRKAILARGNDRLAKLTTSARGEDAAFVHDDRPVPGRAANLDAFMGEQSDMPPPRPASTASTTTSSTARTRTASSATATPSASDPSVWSQDQQEQFMRALMGSGLAGQGPNAAPQAAGPTRIANGTSSDAPAADENPMAQLMAAMASAGAGPQAGGSPFDISAAMGASPFANMAGAPPAPPKPRSLGQKLLPFMHLFASLALLSYFVFWLEPAATSSAVGTHWLRWNELRKEPGQWGWSLRTVPFFTAFLTLEVLLQSVRIATGLDRVQLPMLVSLALPSLPPPIPSLVTNGLKYAQIFSVLMDDLSGLIVALGFVVWASGFMSG